MANKINNNKIKKLYNKRQQYYENTKNIIRNLIFAIVILVI